MIVIDASVAVKWVTGEQDREAANQLLAGDEPLIGPFLLRMEVVAALAKKARFGELAKDDALAAADLWDGMISGDVTLLAEEADLTPALILSLEFNHPLQDCVYLALAERLDATLVTADERFAAKVHRKYPRVRALANFRPK